MGPWQYLAPELIYEHKFFHLFIYFPDLLFTFTMYDMGRGHADRWWVSLRLVLMTEYH